MAFDTIVNLYDKAFDKVAAKKFLLHGANHRKILKLATFREEYNSGYIDYYAEPSKGELLEIMQKYPPPFLSGCAGYDELIAELHSGNEYEKYEIHIMEWESGWN